MEQIPPDYFDIGLLHPTITMQRYAPAEYIALDKGQTLSDRDNDLVATMDLLVRAGILRGEDSDRCNNGRWTVEPTQVGTHLKTIITLETPDA